MKDINDYAKEIMAIEIDRKNLSDYIEEIKKRAKESGIKATVLSELVKVNLMKNEKLDNLEEAIRIYHELPARR